MHLLWNDRRWVSDATRASLERALEIRRTGARRDLTEDDLRESFRRLCEEAFVHDMPPEAVLEVFRAAWDHWFSHGHGDDPRDLRYYGTLSQCLDVFFERALREAPGSGASTASDGYRDRPA